MRGDASLLRILNKVITDIQQRKVWLLSFSLCINSVINEYGISTFKNEILGAC
jgi:hypothetical protein